MATATKNRTKAAAIEGYKAEYRAVWGNEPVDKPWLAELSIREIEAATGSISRTKIQVSF